MQRVHEKAAIRVCRASTHSYGEHRGWYASFLLEVNKQHNYGGKFISLKIILTKEIKNLCLQTQLKTK